MSSEVDTKPGYVPGFSEIGALLGIAIFGYMADSTYDQVTADSEVLSTSLPMTLSSVRPSRTIMSISYAVQPYQSVQAISVPDVMVEAKMVNSKICDPRLCDPATPSDMEFANMKSLLWYSILSGLADHVTMQVLKEDDV